MKRNNYFKFSTKHGHSLGRKKVGVVDVVVSSRWSRWWTLVLREGDATDDDVEMLVCVSVCTQ